MLRVGDDWAGEHFAFDQGRALPHAQSQSSNLSATDESKTFVAVEHGPDGPSATIADAHLLFTAHFVRAGNDLVLHGDGHKTFVVQDYYASDERARLLSADGAALSPDVVDALAGPQAPGQYTQAGTQQARVQAVGRVAAVDGDATIVRNGVAITAHVGDAVLKGDVLQTVTGTIGVTFNDGSTLNLTAHSRMVVNEFVYQPNGNANSQLLNLVQGSLTFISGEVAHSGNMKIGTPVATMGIRGTVGGVTTANDGTVHFYVSQSATGAVIIDSSGNVIANVVQDGPMIVVHPVGPLQVLAEEVQKSPQELATELAALQYIINTQAVGQQIIQQFFQNPNNPNPQSTDKVHTQIQIDLHNNQTNDNGDHTPDSATVTIPDTTPPETPNAPPLPPIVLEIPIPPNLPPVITVNAVNVAPIISTQLLNNNFDGENSGHNQGGFTAFHDFAVNGQTDLIGEDGNSQNFYPGNGLYVDLRGSGTQPRTVLTSKTVYGPGTYTLTLDLAGPHRDSQGNSVSSSGVTDTTTVTFGNYSESFTPATGETLHIVREITLASSASLVISDPGSSANGNIGNILLDVSVTSPSVVPNISYAQGTPAAALDSQLTISDLDSVALAGAVVSIANFNIGNTGDLLGFTDQYGIHGDYDYNAGVLTLSGEASVADYQAALRSVTFSNNAANPSLDQRTINFQVDDGASNNHQSNMISATVDVVPAPQAPTLIVVHDTVVAEPGGSVLLGIAVLGHDLNDHLSVTIAGLTSGDSLTNLWGEHFTIDGDGHESITLNPLQLLGLTLHPGSESLDNLTVTAFNTENGAISATLPQSLSVVVDAAPVAHDDNIITNIHSGTAFQIPDWILLQNDHDPDNGPHQLAITDVSNAVSSTVSHQNSTTSFTDKLTFVDLFHNGGSFDYTVSDSVLSDTGHVTVSVDGSGSLDGTSGNDILVGKAGGSTIKGNGGNDILIGGTGNDTMIGGNGADTFVFAKGGHADTITDFAASHDVIALDNFAFNTFAELQSAATITDIGHGNDAITKIDFGGGDTLTIDHVNPHDLSAADFIFHPHSATV